MRLKERYKKEIIPAMMKEFGMTNKMAVPNVKKVVVNVGFGKAISSFKGEGRRKFKEGIVRDIGLICGQKPAITKAKRSISGFKLREGSIVGAKATLRGERMFAFLSRLINVALPRSRDFGGIREEAIDGQGNLTIGIKENIDFPAVSLEKVVSIFGFEVTIVTNARGKKEAIKLFKLLGFPMKEAKVKKIS